MNHYDITVIYAHHSTSPGEASSFPAQTLSADRIQVLPVQEDDVYQTHKNSLERMKDAEGTYTILLDEGDQFDHNLLEQMFTNAEKSNGAFVMPSLIFEHVKRPTEYFSLNEKKDILLDAAGTPYVFPIDLQGLLIPTAALKEALVRTASVPNEEKRFTAVSDKNNCHSAGAGADHCHCAAPAANVCHCAPPEYSSMPEREKQIILDLLRANPHFLYLGTSRITYALAKECNAQFDIRCMTKEWYYEPFTQFMLPLLQEESRHKSRIYALVQYMALYMIRIRFFSNRDNKNKHVLPPEEVPSYVTFLSGVLQYIETEYIVNKEVNTALSSNKMRLLELRMKKNDPTYYPELSCGKKSVVLMSDGFEFCDMQKLQVKINLIDYEDGKLVIDGLYTDLLSENTASVCAKFDKDLYPLTYNRRYSLTKYFGVSFSRMKTFHVEIPVKDASHDRILKFVLCAEGKEYTLDYGFPSSTSRFAKDFTYGYWRFDKYLAFWNWQGIHVVPSGKLLVLKKEICLWLQMWKKKNGIFRDQIPMKIANFLLRPYFKKQKIWLFLDKIYKGGDSSEYIYKYAEKQNDGIKKYYLLDESAADYERMRKEGYRPLKRGTLKHHLIFLNADLVIASNSTVFAFNDFTFERSLAIRGDTHFQVACVQHGMSVQKIAIAQQRLRDNTRLYFCASKYEIENLSKPVYDYEGYDALKLTGVPRYDGLKDRAQKILLLSPTWRMNSALPVSKSEGFSRDYNPNFRETSYYKVYNSLINDPKLLEAARKYGYRIQYVLHPIVSPQAEDFTKNDLVEIIPSIGNMSYEKIFCEAALMVTDFSGVQFDFAYMRKPVVYLHHHDIPQHYEEGTFHYNTMGFGEICHTNDELIDVLCEYMKNDCVMPEFYRRRADDFFEFSDNNNCQRIYPIMLDYTNRRRNSN